MLVRKLNFGGRPTPRNLVPSLSQIDKQTGRATATLYYVMGRLSETEQPEWKTYTASIGNTAQTDLPEGWSAVNEKGETRLPEGRTFADILAHVDQISFSTFQPGFVYASSTYDVIGDNMTVER